MFALQEKKPNKAKWLAIVYFSLLVFHEINLHSQFKDAHFTGTIIDLNVVTSEPGELPSKAELMFMGLLKLLTLGMTGLYLSYRRVA